MSLINLFQANKTISSFLQKKRKILTPFFEKIGFIDWYSCLRHKKVSPKAFYFSIEASSLRCLDFVNTVTFLTGCAVFLYCTALEIFLMGLIISLICLGLHTAYRFFSSDVSLIIHQNTASRTLK